jgi:hypothetical protein
LGKASKILWKNSQQMERIKQIEGNDKLWMTNIEIKGMSLICLISCEACSHDRAGVEPFRANLQGKPPSKRDVSLRST